MRDSYFFKLGLNAALIFVVSAGITACGGDDEAKVRPSSGRDTRTVGDGRTTTGVGTAGEQSTAGFTGVVWKGVGVSQSEFQARVDGFMSVNANPVDILDLISGDVNAVTGIRFLGVTKVEMSDGAIVNHNSSGALKVGTGDLKILIWDEKARSLGKGFQPSFSMISGNISGGKVTMNFEDDDGKFTIEGWFDQGYFYGYMNYDNAHYWNGVDDTGRGEANRLGEFFIPMCDYFRCD